MCYVVGIYIQVTGEAWVFMCVFDNGIAFSICNLEAKSLSYVLDSLNKYFSWLKTLCKRNKPASK